MHHAVLPAEGGHKEAAEAVHREEVFTEVEEEEAMDHAEAYEDHHRLDGMVGAGAGAAVGAVVALCKAHPLLVVAFHLQGIIITTTSTAYTWLHLAIRLHTDEDPRRPAPCLSVKRLRWTIALAHLQ